MSLFITPTIFCGRSFSAKSSFFCPLVFLRGAGTYKFRGSVPLSYTRAREIVLRAFDAIGLLKQARGGYSLI